MYNKYPITHHRSNSHEHCEDTQSRCLQHDGCKNNNIHVCARMSDIDYQSVSVENFTRPER